MEVQAALASDIAMVFDECAPGEASPEDARRSLELTARWARRSRAAFDLLQSGLTGANETPAVPVTEEPSAAELNGKQALFGMCKALLISILERESESHDGNRL